MRRVCEGAPKWTRSGGGLTRNTLGTFTLGVLHAGYGHAIIARRGVHREECLDFGKLMQRGVSRESLYSQPNPVGYGPSSPIRVGRA